MGSAAALLSWAVFLILLVFSLNTYKYAKKNSKHQKHTSFKSNSISFKIALMFQVTIFILFIQVWQAGTYDYIYSYSISYLEWNKGEAVYLNMAFWVSVAAGRTIGIFTVKCLQPRKVMCIGTLVLMVSVSILHCFVKQSHLVLWLCMLIMTVAMAPLLGATLTWLDQHMDVQGLVGSMYFMAVRCSSSMGPFIHGHLISHYGYQIFTYTLLINSALLLATNIVMQMFTLKCSIKRSRL